MRSGGKSKGQPVARRGRPERSFIERARDVCWANYVRAATHLPGSPSPRKVRESVRRASSWGKVPLFPTPSVFYKYLRGEAGPRREVVLEIDRVVGGLAIFDHPLWSLAALEQPTSARLGELFRALPEPLSATFLLNRDEEVVGPFWRRRDVDYSAVARSALERPSIDGTALALAAVRDSLLHQGERAHFVAWRMWAIVGDPMNSSDPAKALFPHFFALLVRLSFPRRFHDKALENDLSTMRSVASADEDLARRVGVNSALRAILGNTSIGKVSIAELSFLKQLIKPGRFLEPF